MYLGLFLGLNAKTPVSGLETCLQPKADLSCVLEAFLPKDLSFLHTNTQELTMTLISPRPFLRGSPDPALLLVPILTGWDRINQKGH